MYFSLKLRRGLAITVNELLVLQLLFAIQDESGDDDVVPDVCDAIANDLGFHRSTVFRLMERLRVRKLVVTKIRSGFWMPEPVFDAFNYLNMGNESEACRALQGICQRLPGDPERSECVDMVSRKLRPADVLDQNQDKSQIATKPEKDPEQGSKNLPVQSDQKPPNSQIATKPKNTQKTALDKEGEGGLGGVREDNSTVTTNNTVSISRLKKVDMTPPPDAKDSEIKSANKLLAWVAADLKNVSSMRKQMGLKEAVKLLKKYPKKLILEKLTAMDNKAKLTTTYMSVYLTADTWCRMQIQRDGGINSAVVKPVEKGRF